MVRPVVTASKGTPRARGRSLADWTRRAREMTARTDRAQLRKAAANYRKLTFETQMRLAREIAETRGHELTVAYRNLVLLAAGLKRKRPKGSDAHTRIEPVPCVVFFVKKKWSRDRHDSDTQRLPPHLLTYATVAGDRVMCAVPTDVVPAAGPHKAHAESAAGFTGKAPRDYGSFGNATCAVALRRGSSTGKPLMMCCQHVMSPVPELNKHALRSGVPLYDARELLAVLPPKRIREGAIPNGLPPIGTSMPIGGRLLSGGSPSFDVQLGDVAAPEDLRAALGALRLSAAQPYFRSVEAFDKAARYNLFQILLSANNPFWLDNVPVPTRPAAFGRFVGHLGIGHGIEYAVRRGSQVKTELVHHSWLLDLRLRSGQRTFIGDSGSPVVLELPNHEHVLAGMHIACSQEEDGYHSYVIPAWLLFQSGNYPHMPAGRTLVPVRTI